MSYSTIEILPKQSEIDQLRKELFHVHNELVHFRCEANFYKELHGRNIALRERLRDDHEKEIIRLKLKHKEEVDGLKEIILQLEAKVKLRERQLYGKKSEKGTTKSESTKKDKPKRNRGQQRGNKSPPKRDYSHLPVVPEFQDIPEDNRICSCCNAPYEDIGSTEDSDIIEVNVKAHVRRVKRRKYRRTCNCASQPVIITAPQVSKVLSKSNLGNSVWTYFLLQKFWHGHPLHRIIQNLASHNLEVSAGTIIGGFMRLMDLFIVIYQMIIDRSLLDKHWHADETGWKVFEPLEGKANNRWFLWIFRSKSAAVYVMNPSRSAKVVEGFFEDESKGIISCDRYRAYFCFVSKSNGRFSIAYCWVHVRRDFLAIIKDHSIHSEWGTDWVHEIRELYHLNNLRIAQKEDTTEFKKCQTDLEDAVKAFKQKADKQLENKKLADPCRKALESIDRHWHGLITFVKNPEVPMDNNTAERGLRGGAVGRKNYYGSGSVDSAEFTAIMFTIIQTLLIWNINPHQWFNKFFDFIGSDWEKNFEHWLPWNMSSERKAELSLKKSHDPPR